MKYLFLVLSFVFALNTTFAETIKGTVKGIDGENKEVILPGANILWLGTKKGTVSNSKGQFQTEKPNNSERIIVSYIGYISDTLNIRDYSGDMTIVLNSELNLGEINVQGKASARTIKNSTIHEEEISLHGLRKAACCNLAESFETNPSVDVSFTDAVTGAKQIQLLGLAGTYTQILTEKRPNVRGIASKFGLSHIPGPWMESIQISKGVASVQTGYEAMTGQINVEYKKPEFEKTHLNVYSNNQERFELNGNQSFDVTNKLSTAVFLHGASLKNELDHNGDSFLDVPLTENINLMNRWKYEGRNLVSNFGANVLYENRQSGQTGFYNDLDNKSNYYGIDIETQRYEGFLKSGYIFDGDLEHSVAVLSNISHHTQNSFFGNNTYDAEQNSAYANLIYNVNFDINNSHEEHNHSEHAHAPQPTNHEINLGASIQSDNFINELQNSTLDTLMKRNEIVPGGFFEYTYKGINDLVLIAGVRADFHNLYGTFFTPRFHAKYDITHSTAIRASAGKGYRVPDIFSENTGVLASSRHIYVNEEIQPEEAWNYGLNITSEFFISDIFFTLNTEFYRTDFINQLIVDLDKSPTEAHFYNLNGESYSNSFQTDLSFEPFRGIELLLAYRFTDVKETIDGQLRDKYLHSRNKGFLNVMYTTPNDKWSFDITGIYNGSGKLPNTSELPEEFRLDDTFPAYFTMMGQITYRWEPIEIYLGGENLTGFTQNNPIIGFNDPFGNYFDTSYIWGPLHKQKIYLGLRWTRL